MHELQMYQPNLERQSLLLTKQALMRHHFWHHRSMPARLAQRILLLSRTIRSTQEEVWTAIQNDISIFNLRWEDFMRACSLQGNIWYERGLSSWDKPCIFSSTAWAVRTARLYLRLLGAWTLLFWLLRGLRLTIGNFHVPFLSLSIDDVVL